MSNRGYQQYEEQLRLPQAFAYQCDMLIWRNRPGLGALNHPGHASLVVRRTVNEGPWHGRAGLNFGLGAAEPEIAPESHRYVSFWPHGEMESAFDRTSARFNRNHLEDMYNELGGTGRRMLAGDRTQPREGQIVIGQDRDLQDVWGQRHEATVSVIGLSSAREDRLGLALNRIVSWAARFRTSEEFSYVFASKTQNCAGVAVRAMQAGGADAFTPLGGNPAKPSFYIVPNDAQRWANAVRLGVEECNRMLAVLRNRTRTIRISRASSKARDLMPVQEWKAKSDVPRMARGRLTTAIDKALAEYHEKDWGSHFEHQLKRLVTIIRNLHDHLREESRRDAAYLLLASQVVDVVAVLSRTADRHWTTDNYYGTKYDIL